MNMTQVQKRLEEIAAESLTLANALGKLIGEAAEQSTVRKLKSAEDFEAGTNVFISADFINCVDQKFPAGTYLVEMVDLGDTALPIKLAGIGAQDPVWVDLDLLLEVATVTQA